MGHGNLEVPKELKQVLKFHVDLDYPDFYGAMQSMDVVVPAFVNYDCTFVDLRKTDHLPSQYFQTSIIRQVRRWLWPSNVTYVVSCRCVDPTPNVFPCIDPSYHNDAHA